MADRNGIDVLRPDPRLDDKVFVDRQQLDNVLARRQNAAIGVLGERHDNALDRRPHLETAEDVARGDNLLFEIGNLRLHLAQFLERGLGVFRLEVIDLAVMLGDLLLGPRHLRGELAEIAFELGVRAAQGEQSRQRGVALIEELLGGGELAGDQFDLGRDRFMLRLEAGDLFSGAVAAALEDVDFAVQLGPARSVFVFLGGEDFADP